MSVRQVPIALPSMGEEEWLALKEPILSGWVTQGPKVAAFEQAFAARHQVPHAVAVTSCTTGLHLALAAWDIGPGDQVIVPSFTWVATANAVVQCGATPVLVDVDPVTFNLDPHQVSRALTEHTRAIIPVHLFGRCADMEAIRERLPAHVKILEDAACAAGAEHQGRMAGSLGDAAVFSFHPRKSITTGEGGMITTRDDQLAERLIRLRNHGASIPEEVRHHGPKPHLLPDFDLMGFNYRMTDLQGALGLVQLSRMEGFLAERREMAAWYRRELADVPWLLLPQEPENGRHGWQAFVTVVDPGKAPCSRERIMELLQARGVATRPGTHAVHLLGYYRRRFRFAPEDFPGALACHNQTMAIPLHNRMTLEDYRHVVDCLRNISP